MVLVTACGVLLLLARVQVGMRQRHQELVVWRTLGAGKTLLRTTLWAEFALLGVVSGLVAAIGAEVALAMLQTKVFDFSMDAGLAAVGYAAIIRRYIIIVVRRMVGITLIKRKSVIPTI